MVVITGDPTLFDRWGLYSYGDICFSRDGKLDKTVIRLVCESEAGLTQRELQDLLKVRVQVLLLEAVRHKKICREKVGGFYLYLHNAPTIMEFQLQVRQSRIVTSLLSETKDTLQIDSHIGHPSFCRLHFSGKTKFSTIFLSLP